MFEFRRLFMPAAARARHGLSGDDAALLELLDLRLLGAEAQAADVTAHRERATDRSAARLRQARAWREVARRSGDPVVLRRAASAAETTLTTRPLRIAEARLEQALCALQGVDMFGDEGLSAAADRALVEAAGATGLIKGVALGKRALIAARQSLAAGDPMAALAALTGYDPARQLLARASAPLAEARIDRAIMTARCGQALKSDALIARAGADLADVIAALEPAYHPLTWTRAQVARARALLLLAAANADVAALGEAVENLSRTFDVVLKDHSPLDWAAAHAAHGEVLWALARASGLEDSYAKASGAFDRAWSVLRDQPALRARAHVGERRGALAVEVAVHHADRLELDAVEAGFRCDLAAADPHRDPVGWALCQLNLGRVYMARAELGLSGQDQQKRAAFALAEAREIFADYHLEDIAAGVAADLALNV